MRKTSIWLSVLLFLVIFGNSLLGREAPVPVRTVSPMMQEIQAVLERGEVKLAALQEQLAGAPSEKDALQILRAISKLKQGDEIAILRIQARYAREAGDEVAALRIERTVERILNPQPAEPSPDAIQEKDARQSGGGNHE